MIKLQVNNQGKAYLTGNNKVLVGNKRNSNIVPLNVTPSASAQQITASGGTDGYAPVNVAAVTSSVDSNIIASNIKSGVTILGVTGSYGDSINIPREVTAQGKYQMPTSNFSFNLPSNVINVNDNTFNESFVGCTGLTSVSFPGLTTISGTMAFHECFMNCTNLTDVYFPALTNISGVHGFSYTFQGCTALTSISFPALTIISNEYACASFFQGCTGLTSINFSNLMTISGTKVFSFGFRDCTGLTTMSFPALNNISGSTCFQYAFRSCTNLTSISFPALTTTSFGSNTDQFTNMMYQTGSTKTHTIHFPSNLQSIVSGLSGYPTFGGTSGKVTVSFDLPATS